MKLSRLLSRDPAAPTLRERAAALREGLNRREAVLGAAIAAAPLPVIAAPVDQHPDTPLIALWQRVEDARSAERVAAARWDSIEDAEGIVRAPEALYVRDGDDALGILSLAFGHANGRLWYCVGEPGDSYRAAALRQLRRRRQRRPVRPEDNLPADAHTVVELRPWPEAQARADAIVSAWDGWRAEIAHQNEASGFNPAKAAWKACDRAVVTLEEEIAATEARTLVGLTIKARIALAWDENGYGNVEELTLSIAADLIALDTPAA